MTFLQSCWASRGVGSFWSLRVIAFLCSVTRSVTKSHFAPQWWPLPLDFTRNDKNEWVTSQDPSRMARYAQAGPAFSVVEEVSEKKNLPRRSPRNTGCFSFWDAPPETQACFWLPSLSSCLLFGFLDSTEPFETPKYEFDLKFKKQWSVIFDLYGKLLHNHTYKQGISNSGRQLCSF